jgi:hypothetical protein
MLVAQPARLVGRIALDRAASLSLSPSHQAMGLPLKARGEAGLLDRVADPAAPDQMLVAQPAHCAGLIVRRIAQPACLVRSLSPPQKTLIKLLANYYLILFKTP